MRRSTSVVRWGYVEAGVIPRYALDAKRRPYATVFFYKEL